MATVRQACLFAVIVACSVPAATCLGGWQKAVLDKHNALRRTVAQGRAKDARGRRLPKAANMYEMMWDDTMARAAQKYADKCTMTHDSANNMAKGWGENMGMGSKDQAKHVQIFYDEIKKYTGDPAKFKWDYATGHFTQVIWFSSIKLGCGYKVCKNQGHLVCRYGPGGNNLMRNSKVYTPGTPCSMCLQGGSTCSNNLCRLTASGLKKLESMNYFG